MNVVRALEEAAFQAWPAETVVNLDGWRLRSMQGVTRRANSVWPNRCCGSTSLRERVARAESFYDQLHQPRIFQLGPLSCPQDLEPELERKGYTIDAPVAIQIAEVKTVLERTSVLPTVEVCIESEPSAELIQVLGKNGRFAEALPIFVGLLERLRERGGYAVASVQGQPAAAGLLIFAGEWAGVFSMRTEPSFRARGIARSLLASMAAHAARQSAVRLYLQVERDNLAALALYQRAGFAELYGYHYRRHPGVTSESGVVGR